MAAVLGALMAQVDLGAGAIGGKDSMSGSFEDEAGELNVPPTLISFAVAVGRAARATSPEFKGLTHRVVRIAPATYGEDYRPDAQQLLAAFDAVEALTATGDALAISTPGYGCGAESLFKMCVGNQIGIELAEDVDVESLFTPLYGSFIVELAEDTELPEVADGVVVEPLGTTVEGYVIDTGSEVIELSELQEAWESGIEGVFAYRSTSEQPEAETIDYRAKDIHVYGGAKIARPRVIIPVFPGNNCEYDSARAFRAAGAEADTFVINNLTPEAVAESTHELARRIRQSQIVMIPGGFSGGDEPDGSAKFITAFFRAPEVTEAVRDLLKARDGLMLGICNGFQALVKLGLVPYGDIVDATPDAPTLTFNTIGRHQSRLVRTRISSNLSPWLSQCSLDDPYTVAISHGEGRFVANDEVLAQLIANGQVATQYVGEDGKPSMDLSVNPNGSALAIEGITSPDGRVLGKMGHAERRGDNLYRNVPEHVPGDKFMPIFESGVAYFA
jgi:phosphoribosylformylglycinamidine synthase